MPAVIQFVDSISASPTVRLDINDSAVWFCQSFKAPPPRLRRSVSQNAMRDGEFVSSSSYEARVLEVELTLIKEASEDLAATEMQKLWRELDRADNILKYQPQGATKPVFFRLSRSDVEDLEELWTAPIARNITISLFAEPFALGLKETAGPFTVNNNPAAGSNGLYFDVTGVLGDVANRPVIWDSASVTSAGSRTVCVTHTSSTPTLIWAQAEAGAAYNDTSFPVGGPDALMSGTGTNNYTRTSFATVPAMARRMRWTSTALRGSYRVVAYVRRSAATSAITVQARNFDTGQVTSPTTVASNVGVRLIVDCGVLSFPSASDQCVGYGTAFNSLTTMTFDLEAARVGGSDTLDWDAVVLIPVGAQAGQVADPSLMTSPGSDTHVVIDAIQELVNGKSTNADPTTGSALFAPTPRPFAGGVPALTPGATINRFHYLASDQTAGSPVSMTTTVNLAYWPCYVYVRPSAT